MKKVLQDDIFELAKGLLSKEQYLSACFVVDRFLFHQGRDMEIKQIINNNVVISDDGSGEVIVFGKGIGFNGKVGQKIDPSAIEKTFVLQNEGFDPSLRAFLDDIPYDVVKFGVKATDYIVRCSNKKISRRILIPLTDHIYSCIERNDSGVRFDTMLSYNVRYLYKDEYKIAEDVIDMMVSDFGIEADKQEAAFITTHIVNAELDTDIKDIYTATDIISMSVETVEEFFNIRLNNDDINFARFITHLQFFAKRMVKNTFLEEDTDIEINKHINLRYPNEYKCAKLIGEKIKERYGFQIEDNEYTYLTIHIARLLR